jgi:hypothetical protein
MKDFDKNKNMQDPLKLLRYCLGGETEFRKNLSIITTIHGGLVLRNKGDRTIAIRFIRWANDYSKVYHFKLKGNGIYYDKKSKVAKEQFIRDEISSMYSNL